VINVDLAMQQLLHATLPTVTQRTATAAAAADNDDIIIFIKVIIKGIIRWPVVVRTHGKCSTGVAFPENVVFACYFDHN